MCVTTAARRCGSRRRTSPHAASSASPPASRRCATGCRWSTGLRVRSPTSCGRPGSGRSSTGSTSPSSETTATPASCAAWPTCPDSSSSGWRSSTHSARCSSPGPGATPPTLPGGSPPGGARPRGCPWPLDARRLDGGGPDMGVVELEQARAAFDRGDWDVAFEGWSRADIDTLCADDLEDLATTAELLGRYEETTRALHRAFRRRLADGRPARAVGCAFRLAMAAAEHGEPAQFAGWAARAEQLVTETGEDGPALGWVAVLRMFRALAGGASADAAAAAEQAGDVARLHDDPDLTAMAMCSRGRLALYAGRAAEGLALLDEAMVRVLTGELSPVVAGHVYCTAIEGCQEISDFT